MQVWNVAKDHETLKLLGEREDGKDVYHKVKRARDSKIQAMKGFFWENKEKVRFLEANKNTKNCKNMFENHFDLSVAL